MIIYIIGVMLAKVHPTPKRQPKGAGGVHSELFFYFDFECLKFPELNFSFKWRDLGDNFGDDRFIVRGKILQI